MSEKIFFNKIEAITYYLKNNDSNLKLFEEDKNEKGAKIFIISTIKNIFDKLKIKKNYYEFWTKNQQINFFYDYDVKLSKEEINVDNINEIEEIHKKNILLIIKNTYQFILNKDIFDKKVEEEILLNNVIALKSNLDINNPKISYHIIFKDIECPSIKNCKFLAENLIKKNEEKFKYIDKSVYKPTCLRLCYNSKFGKNNILYPVELKCKYKNKYLSTYNNFDQNNLDYNLFKLSMITNLGPQRDIIIYDKSEVIEQDNICTFKEISNKYYKSYNINLVNYILKKLPNQYFDDYDYWLKIGIMLFNTSLIDYENEGINISNDYLNEWIIFSKQSKKYEKGMCEEKWKTFKLDQNDKMLTIGTLISWAKLNDINIVDNMIKNIVENYDIKYFNNNLTYKNYQNKKENNIKNISKFKLNPEDFKELDNYRLFCLKSEKGTGKTYNLIEYMFNCKNNININDNTTILFLSSRRTFGAKLFGDLQKYGFELYSDIKSKKITANKIICQIDSMNRLDLNNYEYIIIDECESLLRYMTSTHFLKNKNSSEIRDYFEIRLNEAKKIIIMDADLSDKSLDYIFSLLSQKCYDNLISNNDIFILINEYKYYKDYTIAYSDCETWLQNLLNMIGQNKKIIIPSASNEKAKDIKQIIDTKFPNLKTLLINKNFGNTNKIKNFLNVNNTWINYDVIIYTPTVCMGVSFDIEHFDYIFAYGCSNSLSALEFCQMLHRIRSPKNKIIYLTVKEYRDFKQNSDNFDFKKIKNYICNDYYITKFDISTDIVNPKITKNKYHLNSPNLLPDEKVIIYKNENDPIFKLFLYNLKETLENKNNFSYQLFSYFKIKEYQLLFIKPIENDKKKIIKNEMDAIQKDRKNNEKTYEIDHIFEAECITKSEYLSLINLNMEEIPEEDVYKIKKYKLTSYYSVDYEHLTKDFIEKYNNEDIIKHYINLSYVLESSNESTYTKLNNMRLKQILKYDNNFYNCFKDLSIKNNYIYHYYAISIIYLSGFDINDLNIFYDKTHFLNKIKDAIFFVQQNYEQIIYKFNLSFRNDIPLIQQNFDKQLKFINKIIYSQYGMKIKYDKKLDIYFLSDNDMWNNIPRDIKVIPKIINL